MNSNHTPTNLLKLSYEELTNFISDLGERPFRAKQIFEGLHNQGVSSIDGFTTLSKHFREKLKDQAFIPGLTIDAIKESSDGTRKYQFKTHDGHIIESVFIPNASRPGKNTICISSQIGCAMGCTFCATSKIKLKRNLDASEIAGQVYLVHRDLKAIAWKNPHPDMRFVESSKASRLINNIVYMGMGEPLHNFDEVKRSIQMLGNADGMNYSPRRITVSTSGVVKNIARLGIETDVHLAVSLNATTNSVRDEIMPVNKKWDIEDLLAVLGGFPLKARDRITFEYVLLDGINDSDDDADRLCKLVGHFKCKLNLIPFNEHPLSHFKKPPQSRVDAFKKILRRRNLEVFVRSTRGDDVDAACGMLGAKKLEESRLAELQN